jgi:hypothetical protein
MTNPIHHRTADAQSVGSDQFESVHLDRAITQGFGFDRQSGTGTGCVTTGQVAR